MIKVKKIYKKIFFVDSPEKMTSDGMDDLLMVSTKNWNHYFSKISSKVKSKLNIEKMEDVNLLKFDTGENMRKYMKGREKNLIDFSLEFDEPCLLEFA